ncbi:MAG: hypothetical protein K2N89_06200 [Lachnospiraceae bacterium]|nr:hypothetical protein [Lachnospiraceae bacterium]
MSAIKMTQMSYLFIILAVLFGAVAVTLFFAYDIGRCWRIVRGKRVGAFVAKTPVRQQKKHIEMAMQHDRTQKLVHGETMRPSGLEACRSTVLLDMEETEQLETMYLVQDITMVEAR